jgi:hypothetical protein
MIAPKFARMSAQMSAQMSATTIAKTIAKTSAMPVPFEPTPSRRARGQGVPAGERGGR